VVDYQRVKPGKGHSFLRTRLRDLERGGMISKTFMSEEKIEQAFLETRKAQFTYREGETCFFMDTESFEQEAVSAAKLDRQARYLQEGMEVSLRSYGDRLISVELPDFVDARVVETDPGLKGDTAAGGSKPAKIETGATVTVPLFVNIGDRVRVDTRTGHYVQRVSGD
jgi:elongation factor P